MNWWKHLSCLTTTRLGRSVWGTWDEWPGLLTANSTLHGCSRHFHFDVWSLQGVGWNADGRWAASDDWRVRLGPRRRKYETDKTACRIKFSSNLIVYILFYSWSGRIRGDYDRQLMKSSQHHSTQLVRTVLPFAACIRPYICFNVLTLFTQ